MKIDNFLISSATVTFFRGFPLHGVICMGLYIPRNICYFYSTLGIRLNFKVVLRL
jgi:hypothetical protein